MARKEIDIAEDDEALKAFEEPTNKIVEDKEKKKTRALREAQEAHTTRFHEDLLSDIRLAVAKKQFKSMKHFWLLAAKKMGFDPREDI